MGRHDLDDAVAAGVLDAPTAARLADFLQRREAAGGKASRFDLTHLLWYAGALIVIGAMGVFSTEAFGRWGGQALALTALAYGIGFALAGDHFARRRGMAVFGGLLATVAVSMAPLATFGVQEHLGWWDDPGPHAYRDFHVWVRGSWVFMSVSAILAASLALRVFRFPFLTAVIAVAMWFLSMDLAPWLLGAGPLAPGSAGTPATAGSWEAWRAHRERVAELRGVITLLIGLGAAAAGLALDLAGRGRFAFWPHLLGGLCVSGGLFALLTDSGLEWALLCAAHVLLLLAAVVLRRRAHAVFGAIGVAAYLGHLSGEVFRDSIAFPFALAGIGVAVLALGYAWFRAEARMQAWLERRLPAGLSRLRPPG